MAVKSYFGWLCDLCHIYKGQDVSYIKLASFLHSQNYIPDNDRDIDRAADGINLRKEYYEEIGHYAQITGRCTMLELMTALAIKMEDIIGDAYSSDRAGLCFWIMASNMGLTDFNDEHFDENEVSYILHNFMTHNYAKNGQGSLFMIRNRRKDMRKADIWKQMCFYLDEYLEV